MSQNTSPEATPASSGPQRGKFPFALSDTNEESKYLTWLRNHSNYLAVGGALNSLGAIAIYVRGVFGNLLILMPVLILAGALLGGWHSQLYNNPFAFTKWFLLYGLSALLLFFGYETGSRFALPTTTVGRLGRLADIFALIVAVACASVYLWLMGFTLELSSSCLGQIIHAVLVFLAIISLYAGYTCHRNEISATEAGEVDAGLINQVFSNFNWFLRGVRGNFAGLILAAVGVALLVELSPHVIEAFRKSSFTGSFGIKECFATIVAAITTLGGLLKFLPRSSELMKTALIILAAAVSIVLVWGVVLRVANFFFYGLPVYDWRIWTPYICVLVLLVSFVVSMSRAGWAGAWTGREVIFRGLIMLLAIAVSPVIVAAIKYDTRNAPDQLGKLTRPLARVIDGLKLTSSGESLLENDSLIADLIVQKSALDSEASVATVDPQVSRLMVARDNKRQTAEEMIPQQFLIDKSYLKTFLDTFSLPDFVPQEIKHFERAGNFLERVETLSDRDVRSQAILLRTLTDTGSRNLITMAKRDSNEPIGFQSVVLERVLKHILESSFTVMLPDMRSATAEELDKWLQDTDLAMVGLEPELARMYLPVSLATEYLLLMPERNEELDNYRDRSAPDAALSGPRLFSARILEKESLRKHVERVRLRILLSTLSPDLAEKTVGMLKDKWFTHRDTTRTAFDGFATLKLNGRTARTSEVIRFLIENERDIDGQAIFQRCGIKSISGGIADEDQEADAINLTPCFDGGMMGADAERALAACRRQLIETALGGKLKAEATVSDNDKLFSSDASMAKHVIAELFDPTIPPETELDEPPLESKEQFLNRLYARRSGRDFTRDDLLEIVASRFIFTSQNDGVYCARVIRRVAHGRFGNLNDIESVSENRFANGWVGKCLLLLTLFFSIAFFCSCFVNPNATSIHGFYRDKLSAAFILHDNSTGHVEPERHVKLSQLSDYEPQSGCSIAPYHLINTAINLQGSKELNVRDRNSDFFIFSKLFVGGESTGYISTERFEQAAPEMTAGSAMAISAAAAAPNMGQYTMSLLAFLLTMVNVRLGYWVPNPSDLATTTDTNSEPDGEEPEDRPSKMFTNDFKDVFRAELLDIAKRRTNVSSDSATSDSEAFRSLVKKPCERYRLCGMSLSGGGIRSAAVNLGLLQVLDELQLLPMVDYLSTVSGGGYLGTGVSTFMRSKTLPDTPMSQRNSQRHPSAKEFRPPSRLLGREMTSRLRHDSRWVNVSDGGHIENLGAIELLRRRCLLVIVGEGEADPTGTFPGLSTMMRLASIDLGIEIEFPEGSLRKLIIPAKADRPAGETDEQRAALQRHFSVALIHYPKTEDFDAETGYLLYIRSSIRGNEHQVIKGYQAKHPAFPHESTGDQMFNEGQFEAYRRLGEKMMRDAACEFLPEVTATSTPNLETLVTALKDWHRAESNPCSVEPNGLDTRRA